MNHERSGEETRVYPWIVGFHSQRATAGITS